MLLTKGWFSIFLITISALLTSCGEAKQDTAVQQGALAPFYGTFKGTGKTLGKDEVADRDLTVTIKPWENKGFSVDWSTTIYRDGREKKTNMSIDFYPSPRPGIYASAMATDVFGNTIPYDPANTSDNPYVWAGLEGDALVITALYITDEGGYEMQVYKRTRQDDGLNLEFERLKNGKQIAQISAVLQQVTP